MDITILRLPQVLARTGLSRSTIYAKVSTGEFPEPISLGARAVGWLADEVEAWLVARVEASRGPDSKQVNPREVQQRHPL